MIEIADTSAGEGVVSDYWLSRELSRTMIEQMRRSDIIYRYRSAREFNFEMEMRNAIVHAAHLLNRSGASFATFYETRGNQQYWQVRPNGALHLRPGAEPAAAINDVFVNGSLYAFECATAMVLILYKAILDTIGRQAFNQYFSNIVLWDWEYDRDLGLTWDVPREYLPGDVRYFKNPDVNPQHMEWQGENVIDLGNGLYFGHGIGIRNAEAIIETLNRLRRPGAQRSAYLMNEAGRPNFAHLAQLSGRETVADTSSSFREERNRYVTVTLGNTVRLY
ncbi:MAG TPA: protein-glutamine gamma-glutamyltransferase [Bacillales bacterium]|nr:protein-glutamine gamma-glutamyltransferase [Bacillales bacterium]